jgi:uncharacterized protein (TIGR03118 family)
MRNATKLILGTAVIAFIYVNANLANATGNSFKQTNLVSDGNVPANVTDPNLVNAWGIANFLGGPFWINDNGMGLSTLYDGAGNIVDLVVTIPLPPGSTADHSAPTGIVANSNSTLFIIPGSKQSASFIFDTEDGTLSAWSFNINPTKAQLVVDNSTAGAVYKGLAVGNNATGVFLYATNFHAGTVDVFDSTFKPAALSGNFTDPHAPAGYAPFGIANIRGDLFITYAKQDAAKHDDVPGPGNGFVSIFDTNGNFLRRFASQRPLNAPWAVVQAPYNFGGLDSDILIGNFGDGHITAFDSKTAKLHGQLRDTSGKVISIDGLWGLSFGGAEASDPGTLYFTAGPNEEADGLYGSLTAQ